jgi:LysR family transcriptional regulator (chromosome initiation inhibitor)
MFDPAQLAALAAAHRRGSFDLAAADLHVTPSAISQRIKALEEATGTLLIRRERPCTATETGRRLVRHHDETALLNAALAQDLRQATQTPTLRIAVNADSLATWVIPALAATSGFLYDIVIDDQDVSQDWLRRGDVAAAITGHPGPLQGCDTHPLGALRYRATASPAYVARWMPDGPSAAALARAPALTFSDKDRLQHIWIDRLTQGQASRAGFPSHRIASSHGFVDACLAGLGWGLNPEPLVAEHIATGRLIDLSPENPLDVALHWQFARLTAPALAPLTRAVLTAARAALGPSEDSPSADGKPAPQ